MKKMDSLYTVIGHKSRLSERVVNQITDLILSKDLKPGDSLPPEHLVEEPRVSRGMGGKRSLIAVDHRLPSAGHHAVGGIGDGDGTWA